MSSVAVRATRRGGLAVRLVCLLTVGRAAFAEPTPAVEPMAAGSHAVVEADVVAVTWPDVARLLERQPRVAASHTSIEAARAGLEVARTIPNPTLSAAIGQGRARVGGGSRVEWGIAVSMPLSFVAERGSKLASAQADVELATAASLLLSREVALEMRQLFFGLVYQQAHVASLVELEAQTAALVAIVAMRQSKGEVRSADLTRVEIELEKVRSELDGASVTLRGRQDELGLRLGLPRGKVVQAVADGNALPQVPSRDDAWTRVSRGHPALRVDRARTRQLAAAVDVEKTSRVPEMSVSVFTSDELDRRAYGMGVEVELPVFDWNGGRIAEAEGRLTAGRKESASRILELRAQFLEVQSACHASVVTARRLRDRVLPRSEAACKAIERAYQLGEASLLELVDARRTLLDSRRLTLEALGRAQLDCSDLQVLLGDVSS